MLRQLLNFSNSSPQNLCHSGFPREICLKYAMIRISTFYFIWATSRTIVDTLDLLTDLKRCSVWNKYLGIRKPEGREALCIVLAYVCCTHKSHRSILHVILINPKISNNQKVFPVPLLLCVQSSATLYKILLCTQLYYAKAFVMTLETVNTTVLRWSWSTLMETTHITNWIVLAYAAIAISSTGQFIIQGFFISLINIYCFYKWHLSSNTANVGYV